MYTDLFGSLDQNMYQLYFTKKECEIQGVTVIMYQISSKLLDSIELYYYQDLIQPDERSYKIYEINSGSIAKGGPDKYPSLLFFYVNEKEMFEICKIVLSNNRNNLRDKIYKIYNKGADFGEY